VNADTLQRLQAAGVHTLLVQFTDLHGVAKGKLVPLAQLGEVLAAGAAWMVVHADLPLLRPADLAPVVEHLESGGRAIAPSSDGGTSLLGASDPMPTSYGPGSFHRHLVRLGPGVRVFVSLGLALDLDTVSDLEAARRHHRGAWMVS
jgi:2-phospho-L-lactate guanylyltransferase (CobY/MobA/RfbA family)